MKFYAAPTTELPNGLKIIMAKDKITEAEFTGIINNYIDNSDAPVKEKTATKNKVWETLHKGIPVTLGNRTLTIKKK